MAVLGCFLFIEVLLLLNRVRTILLLLLLLPQQLLLLLLPQLVAAATTATAVVVAVAICKASRFPTPLVTCPLLLMLTVQCALLCLTSPDVIFESNHFLTRAPWPASAMLSFLRVRRRRSARRSWSIFKASPCRHLVPSLLHSVLCCLSARRACWPSPPPSPRTHLYVTIDLLSERDSVLVLPETPFCFRFSHLLPPPCLPSRCRSPNTFLRNTL